MSATLRLNCWVFDDDVSQVFPVKITNTESVGTLKEVIKDKNPESFHNVDARSLTLWKVSIPVNRNLKQSLSAIEFTDETSLLSVDDLFDVFSDVPPRRHLHIVAKPRVVSPPGLSLGPQLDLELFCFIHGDDPSPRHVFSIKIASTESVSTLKNFIKDAKKLALKHVDADSLTLWNVSIAVDKDFKENVSKVELRDEEMLLPVTRLSALNKPLDGHLHIIVLCPPSDGKPAREEPGRDCISALTQRLYNVISGIMKAMAPSDSAKSSAYAKSQTAYSIYDGRYKDESPRTRVALPVELFHPAFGHFLDDVRKEDEIPKDIIRKTTEYMKEASAIYASEDKRRAKLNPLLSDVLAVLIQTVVNNDKTCPDGIVEFCTNNIGLAAILHEEDKNEHGDGGSDPATQVSFSFARCWAQTKFETVRNGTCCPSFLIGTAGPWFVVLGAVITDGVIVQRLTDCVWVGLDSVVNEPRIMHVARIFFALRTNLGRLRDYYKNLQPTGKSPDGKRFFPSITAYRDDDGKTIQFDYVGFLENDLSCTAIHARTRTEPARDIVVKFVERYGERAHKVLEVEDLAPKLLYCNSPQLDVDQPSYGRLTMVVMEYVVGSTLAEEKQKNGLDAEATERVRKEVWRALELLHTKCLVFGDLRPPNVMITEEKKVKLIDFDWAGELGQAKYPCLISPSVCWPDRIEALDIIEIAHDKDMFDRLL